MPPVKRFQYHHHKALRTAIIINNVSRKTAEKGCNQTKKRKMMFSMYMCQKPYYKSIWLCSNAWRRKRRITTKRAKGT